MGGESLHNLDPARREQSDNLEVNR